MQPGCDIHDESLALAALDERPETINAAAAEHLRTGCTRCCGLLRQLRETVQLLPYSLIAARPQRQARIH
jgi:hypothetical protein